MKSLVQLTPVFLCVVLVRGYIEHPGPRYPATKGEIWPKPRSQTKSDNYFILRSTTFEIKQTSNNQCTILKDALVRYELIIASIYGAVESKLKSLKHEKRTGVRLGDGDFLDYLDTLEVNLNGNCADTAYPSFDIKENYTLEISESTKSLNSSTVFGILRGLESFYQSLYISNDLSSIRINKTYVDDGPRFSHRGFLLDTSRHFITLEKILLTIDAMAQNKLNVFHWHIVDDQSFPYVSKKFPELSNQGAYTPFHIYRPSDVQTVIEYARLRGIRVVPEFDTPGHTRSWGVSHPEILTACQGAYAGDLGPINPARNQTYNFINELFSEVKEVFADSYIHLGGDEVGFECWESNSNITAFMEQQNIVGDYAALESYYIQKIINLVDNLDYKSIVWEEVFNNGVKVPKETVIHVWKGSWQETITNVVTKGYNAILSSCWYLDHLQNGGDWQDFYYCEPYSFTTNTSQQSLVIGGEACMWSEVVDSNNVISRVWPRASAAAEKLWSARDDFADMTEVTNRMEEHACRMNRRGIPAQPPSGPGYCI